MKFNFFRKSVINGLSNCIVTFRNLANKKVQMDFVNESGQILAQIYGYKVIRNFIPQLDFGDMDGYIIELYFNNVKTNNEENYKRFLLSEFNPIFKQFDDVEPKEAYFTFIDSSVSNDYFEEYLEKMLRTIYGDKVHIDIKVHGE